jgi:hypothetical protein
MTKEYAKIRNNSDIQETFSYGIIYVYSIPLESHRGRLKIGSATINHSNPTEDQIKSAALERINQQTKTADISYNLEHTELAVTGKGDYFADYDVHQVLIRSGYMRKSENIKNARSEWFEIDLEKAKSAIAAVKEGRQSLTTKERTSVGVIPFSFRPNQIDAINKTREAISKGRKRFLWNAKMRFGKTSAAMQVAKEAEMRKVLIVTHRPSVSVDWRDDFNKIFAGTEYQYSSKTDGEKISKLVTGDKPFIYFASLQDLRLSKRVVDDEASGTQSQGFSKNDEIFDTTWDMLVIDEAHEGTQSELGDTTFAKIDNKFTLELSGTPFNILHKHEVEDVYTWDYVMEQEAKFNWDERYPGVPNPYAELPSISMFTYDIDRFGGYFGGLGEQFKDAVDGAFKFHEFFRVHKDDEGNDTARFVHESMVKKFLDLLVDTTIDTKFPYATEEYRAHNKHSLWLLPNRVKVIEAMEKLLKGHETFGKFGVVNISGNNHDDEEDRDAKNKVTSAIKNHDYTITLTGQRLTTGASIKEWTAVFMMSDTSSATTYLQTAFRCQTPAKIDGKIKTQGYVFDFAPDRTLRLVAEAIELNHKSGKVNSPEQKEAMEQFLNFCPILAASGGLMKLYDVNSMLGQLKRAIAERVYRSGFDDPKLYNDELLQLSEIDIKKFNDLKALVGSTNSKKINEIEINNLGLDGSLQKKAEEAEIKKKKGEGLTEEQKEALKRLQEARKQKQTAVSILRGVSIRMPMLVYGAKVSVREDITLQKFIDIVDEESWVEFMPAGLTKEQFREFIKYYDEDVFKAVAHSIRAKVYDCETLLPTERIQAIAEIFGTFKNPDKETVLTPWNIVNLHLTTAFGGHNFSSGQTDKSGKPVWVSKGVDTSVWEKEDTKILEINAKSGMYPLLAAYNIYTRRLKSSHKKSEDQVAARLWSEVLENNVYVLCKSPMAKSITERTLAGYNKGIKTNIVYIEHLVEKLQQKKGFEKYELKDELLAKFNLESSMKFKAVVGNPPYQIGVEGNTRAAPIYNHFIDAAQTVSDLVCLIHPARFLFDAGQTPKVWNKKMLNDTHLAVIFYEPVSSKLFPNTGIKGGVAITLWDKKVNNGGLGGKFVPSKDLDGILTKIKVGGFEKIVFVNTAPAYPLNPKRPKDKKLRSNAFVELLDTFKDRADKEHNVKIIGVINNIRTEKYISAKLIDDPVLSKWKVFLPESNGSGKFGETLSTPFVAGPDIGCAQTFVQIGSFASEVEARNCIKYIKTKICRSLLGSLKVTQHNPRSVWKNVPIQDFTNKSDIDWSKSVADIDKQLYKKYKLDKKEIDFIEHNVKEMN